MYSSSRKAFFQHQLPLLRRVGQGQYGVASRSSLLLPPFVAASGNLLSCRNYARRSSITFTKNEVLKKDKEFLSPEEENIRKSRQLLTENPNNDNSDVYIPDETAEILRKRTMFEIRTAYIRDEEQLKARSEPWSESMTEGPLKVWTRRYILTDSPMMHPDSRKVILMIRLKDLNLTPEQERKLKLLVGKRYNSITETLKLTTVRYATREQNRQYLVNLLHDLIQEAKDPKETFKELPDPIPTESKMKQNPPYPAEWIRGQSVKYRLLRDVRTDTFAVEEGDEVTMDFEDWYNRKISKSDIVKVYSGRVGDYVTLRFSSLKKLKNGYTTARTLVDKPISESKTELRFNKDDVLLIPEKDMYGSDQALVATTLDGEQGYVAAAHLKWTALDGQIWRAISPNEAVGDSLALPEGALVRSVPNYKIDEAGCITAQYRGKVGRVTIKSLRKINVVSNIVPDSTKAKTATTSTTSTTATTTETATSTMTL